MKTLFFALTVTLLIGPATEAFAQAKAPRTFDQFGFHLSSNYSFAIPELDRTTPIDLEGLSKQGYEGFLKSLNRTAPDLFRAPVLMHTTGSLQPASFERPRAILYGQNLLLSFSEPKETNDRTVEVLKFDPQQATFSAEEISFSSAGVKIDKSPATCKACHGENLRPIWLSYDLWPNAYGSFAGMTSSPQEQTALDTFKNASNKPGVYKYLSEIQDATGTVQGNDSLTVLINNMVGRSFFKSLAKQKQALMPWRYALIAAFKGCSDPGDGGASLPITDFIPSNIQMPKRFDEFKASSATVRSKKTQLLAAQLTERFQAPFGRIDIEARLDNETHPIADTRFLLENFGFSLKPYQTSNGLYDYSMSLPTNLPLDWSTQSVQLFPEVFKELKPDIQDVYPQISWAMFDCQQLKAKSLDALARVTSLPQLPKEREVSPLARCVSCHVVGNGDAPSIPFDNAKQLHTWLQTNEPLVVDMIQSHRMPKNAMLTDSEIAALLAALERIKN